MSIELILLTVLVLGLLCAMRLKFPRQVPRHQGIDADLISAYQALKKSGPSLAEKKKKYEETLRNLKSINKSE